MKKKEFGAASMKRAALFTVGWIAVATAAIFRFLGAGTHWWSGAIVAAVLLFMGGFMVLPGKTPYKDFINNKRR